MMMTQTKTETRTVKMSYDNFEAAITTFLYSMGALNDDEEVIATDFGIEIDPEGMIEFDIEVVKL